MNANTANFGACIYLKSGTVTINTLEANNNISIKGNGGAVNIAGGEAIINNASFTGNKATLDSSDCLGGAVSVSGGAAVQMTDVTFTNNEAVHGGAIALIEGTLTVNGISANGNKATGYTEADAKKSGNGGAIHIGVGSFTLNKGTVITENIFNGNIANSGGGAIYCYNTEASITIDEVKFTENKATTNYGGAMYIRGSAITVDIGKIVAENNTSSSNGGAIYFYAFKNGAVDSIVANNNSSKNGGAIYIAGSCTVDIGELSGSGNSASTNGGFAYIGASTVTIHSGTVGESDDANGKELYCSAKVSINTEKFTYPEGGINDATKIVAITE